MHVQKKYAHRFELDFYTFDQLTELKKSVPDGIVLSNGNMIKWLIDTNLHNLGYTLLKALPPLRGCARSISVEENIGTILADFISNIPNNYYFSKREVVTALIKYVHSLYTNK